jgi:hypothetical protein
MAYEPMMFYLYKRRDFESKSIVKVKQKEEQEMLKLQGMVL